MVLTSSRSLFRDWASARSPEDSPGKRGAFETRDVERRRRLYKARRLWRTRQEGFIECELPRSPQALPPRLNAGAHTDADTANPGSKRQEREDGHRSVQVVRGPGLRLDRRLRRGRRR